MFDADNELAADWSQKIGRFEISDTDLVKKEITADTDVDALIERAQSAGHYAPTGKNPQSSRGHTAFIVEVHLKDGKLCKLLALDLAGSEGITAITPDFVKAASEATANMRLMEFVDKLQSEQKDLLNNLDSKMNKS